MTLLQGKIWTFLTFRGRHIIAALIVTLCAGDEFVLSRIRMQHVVLRAEKHISELPFFYFFAFKIVLYVMEYAIPPFAWKFTRFSRLPLEKQIAYLETWENSKFAAKRNLFKLVKAICICHIFSERPLLAAIGYRSALEARIKSPKRNIEARIEQAKVLSESVSTKAPV